MNDSDWNKFLEKYARSLVGPEKFIHSDRIGLTDEQKYKLKNFEIELFVKGYKENEDKNNI